MELTFDSFQNINIFQIGQINGLFQHSPSNSKQTYIKTKLETDSSEALDLALKPKLADTAVPRLVAC